MKNTKQRVQDYRKRLRDLGLVRIEIYCMPEHAKKLKLLAEGLAKSVRAA
jgi:hypothetical protein